MKIKIECEICGQYIKSQIIKGLSYYIVQKHHISKSEYYDKFLKKNKIKQTRKGEYGNDLSSIIAKYKKTNLLRHSCIALSDLFENVFEQTYQESN